MSLVSVHGAARVAAHPLPVKDAVLFISKSPRIDVLSGLLSCLPTTLTCSGSLIVRDRTGSKTDAQTMSWRAALSGSQPSSGGGKRPRSFCFLKFRIRRSQGCQGGLLLAISELEGVTVIAIVFRLVGSKALSVSL